MKKVALIGFLLFILISVNGQVKSVTELDATYLNWHNLDPEKDKKAGTSVSKAYDALLANKPSKKTIIVAVMDSGVDIDHEDLKGKIWINEDEIPGNKIDDDQNGFIDDVHGWNFLGNAAGENINHENVEYARIIKDKNSSDYDFAKMKYDAELEKRKEEKISLRKFEAVYNDARNIIKSKTGTDVHSLEDLNTVNSNNSDVLKAKAFLKERYERGFTEDILMRLKRANTDYLEKHLNLNFNPRSIIGDNPAVLNDKAYGNPDVKGPRSNHGTSVAGVIAAIRNNGLGIDGIATDVKIMVIRTTPNGDERDKDVALGIKYAVDNGAHIINMSFGKQFSPQKQFVDEMVKFAEQKNVLIVHGSGNSGEDIDATEMYPSDRYLDGSEPANWINVGASGNKLNDELAAPFSNFGQEHVDLFAPGQNIISTDSSSTYSMNDGTSLAAPVVTGIAALLLSYYPDLKPSEVITILVESSYKFNKKVVAPGSGEFKRKVSFSELSKSGGIVNAYNALERASH
jgi:subtilisin family serine protease